MSNVNVENYGNVLVLLLVLLSAEAPQAGRRMGLIQFSRDNSFSLVPRELTGVGVSVSRDTVWLIGCSTY